MIRYIALSLVMAFMLALAPFPALASESGKTAPVLGTTPNAAVLRGHFVQKKYLSEMNAPLVSSGNYVVARNRGLLWQVRKPVSSTLVITPDALIERSNGHQTTHITAKKQPALRAVAAVLLAAFAGNVQQLHRFFNVTTDKNSDTGWALTLVPKTHAVHQFVSRLKIAGKRSVRHIRIDQPGGDHSDITLTPSHGGPAHLTPTERAALSH